MEQSSQPAATTFWRNHSLSVVSLGLLTLFIIAYAGSDPGTHLGAFFGNAVADWSGSVILILGTKFLLEAGSCENRPARKSLKNSFLKFFNHHSPLLVLFF